MDVPKSNCQLSTVYKSGVDSWQLTVSFLKVSNIKSTSQQCKICAPTDQQKFPNWEKIVGEPEC